MFVGFCNTQWKSCPPCHSTSLSPTYHLSGRNYHSELSSHKSLTSSPKCSYLNSYSLHYHLHFLIFNQITLIQRITYQVDHFWTRDLRSWNFHKSLYQCFLCKFDFYLFYEYSHCLAVSPSIYLVRQSRQHQPLLCSSSQLLNKL